MGVLRAINGLRKRLGGVLEGRLTVLQKLMLLCVAFAAPLALLCAIYWRASEADMQRSERQLAAMDYMAATWPVMTAAMEKANGATLKLSDIDQEIAAFEAARTQYHDKLKVDAAADALSKLLAQDQASRVEVIRTGQFLVAELSDAGQLWVTSDQTLGWYLGIAVGRAPTLLVVAARSTDAAHAQAAAGQTEPLPDLWQASGALNDAYRYTDFSLKRVLPFIDADARYEAETSGERLKSAVSEMRDLAWKLTLLDLEGGPVERRADLAARIANAESRTLFAVDDVWHLTFAASRNSIEKHAKAVSENRRASIALAMAILSVAVMFGAMVARSIVRPQRRLAETMRKLVDGKTNLDVPYRDYTNELGEVAGAVEVFRQTLIERKALERNLNEERKELEARVLERTKDIERADAAKTRFVASLSHEIRTPLNGVLGMAAALERSPLNDEQRDMLRVIRGSGDVLLRLLNNAIDITRIESGKLELEVTSFDLAEMLEGAAALYRETALAKGLWLDVSIAPGVQGYYKGDAVRIRQIVQNFVSNAVKFTERGGVAVSAGFDAEGRLRVDVSDTGIGLPREVGRLFQSFSQGDRTYHRRFGGAGLGLAICRELADLMNGEVSAFDRTGGGSVFRLEVALERDEEMQKQEAAEAAPRGLDGLSILAADDNAMNRLVLQTLLSQVGVEADMVENGIKAVEAARVRAYDIILLDLHMPELDGLTAARTIRTLSGPNRTAPIIALTADAMPEQIEACLAAGMNGHVAKPIQVERLLSAIVEALNEPRPINRAISA